MSTVCDILYNTQSQENVQHVVQMKQLISLYNPPLISTNYFIFLTTIFFGKSQYIAEKYTRKGFLWPKSYMGVKNKQIKTSIFWGFFFSINFYSALSLDIEIYKSYIQFVGNKDCFVWFLGFFLSQVKHLNIKGWF